MISLTKGLWKAQLDPDHGMNLVQLTYGGGHILRDPAGEAQPGASCLHGTPLLLPPNRTEAGQFSFEGKRYQLPVNEENRNNHLHGYLRFQAFRITEQSSSSVTAEYENKGDIFPFPFRVRVICCLEEAGCRQEITVENTGKANMPLTFGIHTNFAEKDFFQVPIDRHCAVNACYIPTGELEALTPRQQCFREGMTPDGGNIDGFFTSGGHTARIGRMLYRVSDNFSHWILFNKNGGHGFISIEPQCGGVNCLNTQQGLRQLRPGQKEVFSTWIGL